MGSGRCRGESGTPGDDQVGPRGGGLDVEQEAPAAAGQGRRDGEHPQPQPFGFPPSSVAVVQREQLHPGGQVKGELDDGEPDPVLVEPL